jgi:hypothetical protein
MSAALQLELPFVGELPRMPVRNAVVEVVVDDKEGRPRVRPVNFAGWVKFPRHLREPGARYRVDELRPRPGGAWAAAGRIRRVRRRR